MNDALPTLTIGFAITGDCSIMTDDFNFIVKGETEGDKEESFLAAIFALGMEYSPFYETIKLRTGKKYAVVYHDDHAQHVCKGFTRRGRIHKTNDGRTVTMGEEDEGTIKFYYDGSEYCRRLTQYVYTALAHGTWELS